MTEHKIPMPFCLVEKHIRTPKEQAIWEQLPDQMRHNVLVWIDHLGFPNDEDGQPHPTVWFVDKFSRKEFSIPEPVDGVIDWETLGTLILSL